MPAHSCWAVAQEQWSVTPQICIADTPDSKCSMALTIQPPPQHRVNPAACLFLDEQKQQCWPELPALLNVDVTLEKDTTLTLQQPDGLVLVSRALQVKARQTSIRRRIRSPWRLF